MAGRYPAPAPDGLYDAGDWRFALSGTNLFNRHDISGCQAYSVCMYGNERTVMATATYNWWRPSGGIENARAGSASGIYTCQTAPADATRHRPGRSAPRVGTSIAQAQQACARETHMTRKYIDCREYPSEMNCSVALAADSESELLEAAVQHATTVHKHADTPELRAQLKSLFHDGTPPVETPRHA